jgi:hypothetical protein
MSFVAWAVAFPRCTCVPSPESAVPWLQDDQGYWYLLDTGAPRTTVLQEFVVTELLPEDLLRAPTDVPIGGLIGADVLLQQPWWREGEQVYFGEPPAGIVQLASVPLAAVGGGQTCLEDGQCYEYGATRMLVEVELGGQLLTLLLDTGATYTTLSTVASDGVGLGFEPTEVSARVGELEQESVLVARGDELLDEALAQLSDEVARPVDGLLGQSMLEAYIVGISAEELTFSVRPN